MRRCCVWRALDCVRGSLGAANQVALLRMKSQMAFCFLPLPFLIGHWVSYSSGWSWLFIIVPPLPEVQGLQAGVPPPVFLKGECGCMLVCVGARGGKMAVPLQRFVLFSLFCFVLSQGLTV